MYLLVLVFCISATECHEDAIASFPTFEACDDQAVRYVVDQDLYNDPRGELVGMICRKGDK